MLIDTYKSPNSFAQPPGSIIKLSSAIPRHHVSDGESEEWKEEWRGSAEERKVERKGVGRRVVRKEGVWRGRRETSNFVFESNKELRERVSVACVVQSRIQKF